MQSQHAVLSIFQIFPTNWYVLSKPQSTHLQCLNLKQYPVEIHENSFANAAQVATCVSSISSDWFHNALIIYDIYWSTVAALIQLCVDSQNRQEVYEWTLPDDTLRLKALSLILTTRLELLSQIYSHDYPHSPSRDDQWPGEQMRSLLLLGIHPSCSQDQCLCFNDDRATIQSLVRNPSCSVLACLKLWLIQVGDPASYTRRPRATNLCEKVSLGRSILG